MELVRVECVVEEREESKATSTQKAYCHLASVDETCSESAIITSIVIIEYIEYMAQ